MSLSPEPGLDSKCDGEDYPRNKIFVFSGIIPICATEDGLASVLAHELAHNVAHHAQEKASSPYLTTLILGLVTIFVDYSAQLTSTVLEYAVELPNSRAQEVRASWQILRLIPTKGCRY